VACWRKENNKDAKPRNAGAKGEVIHVSPIIRGGEENWGIKHENNTASQMTETSSLQREMKKKGARLRGGRETIEEYRFMGKVELRKLNQWHGAVAKKKKKKKSLQEGEGPK